ncbi:hypothetical protein LTR08_008766 [Meristemomyces frigidus]|nr:hypothetical protein LTR08_008766 [Meristemomyces frigidus]
MVAAFPCGALGNELRIAQLCTQRQGWDDSKSVWIEVPVIHGEEVTWRCGGPPIQQVRFAKVLERTDNFLAVRMTTWTVILRPFLREKAVNGSFSSRLDPNPGFQLPIFTTGGLPHADVAFNPWYVRQFGVVDQAGRWSVWEMEGRKTTTAQCVSKGWIYDNPRGSATAVADGWARLTWICNPSFIAVSTRKRLALFSVAAQVPRLPHLILDSEATNAWILDVVPVLSHPSYLCVLTPEQILVYTVTSHDSDELLTKLVFSLKHYRNPDDMTAYLRIQEHDEGFSLLLRSCIGPVVTSFALRIEENGGVVASDSTSLSLPNDITGLHFASVAFGKNARYDTGNGTAVSYRDNDISFRNLLYLRTDLALLQRLYVSSPSVRTGADTVLPSWKAQLPPRSSTRLPRERFVIGDSEEDDEHAEHDRIRPTATYVQRRQKRAAIERGTERTIIFEFTAQAVEDEGQQGTESIDHLLDIAVETWQQQYPGRHMPPRTLCELVQSELTIGDIGEASSRLQGLVLVVPDKMHEQEDDALTDRVGTRPVLHHVTTPLHPTVKPQEADASLSAIYDGMVSDWITPLGPNVLDRTRLAKEQLVRRAAAEVALASHVIRMENVDQQPPLESQESQRQTWELPVRNDMPSSSQIPPHPSQYVDFSSQLHSSQSALPTPSNSATNSLATGSSHPSTLAPASITRLSKYTTFSKPTTSALPRALRSVLSHWTPGEDPAAYDWLSSSRRETRRAEDEVDEQTMTEKERARMQRRAEKHLRRQRKEAAVSQAAQFASSQALEIAVSASQSQIKNESQPTGVVASSQSFGLGGMPSASQVVPGRFGGRPPKKKRKQGF